MPATLLNFSRRGDTIPYPMPNVLNQVHAELESWVTTVNGQNPGQLLTILAKPADDAVNLGWTIKAQLLAETSPGVKAELLSQWVMFPATGFILNAVGKAVDYNPAGGNGVHGTLNAGTINAATAAYTITQPLPIGAVTARSTAAGQEYFLFSLMQHTYTNRMGLPIFIAKDANSGNWVIGNISMNSYAAITAWNGLLGNYVYAKTNDPWWPDYLSGFAPYLFRVNAAMQFLTPAFNPVVGPLARYSAVTLPNDLGVWPSTARAFGVWLAPGQKWYLAMGPSGLLVQIPAPLP
jgi:hypothetical protein